VCAAPGLLAKKCRFRVPDPAIPPMAGAMIRLVGDDRRGRKGPMGNPAVGVLYALAMVAVVVAADLLFFRNKTWSWERLAANIGVVLLFGAFYFRFSR